MSYEFLSPKFECKEVDTAKGIIIGRASVYNIVDQGKDLVLPGAFKRTLDHSKGKVPLLKNHDWHERIGTSTLTDKGDALESVSRLIMDKQLARETLAEVKHGIEEGKPMGYSIGYETKQSEPDKETGVRRLKELKLWENSVVTFPMNQETWITAAKGGSPAGNPSLKEFLDGLKELFIAKASGAALELETKQTEPAWEETNHNYRLIIRAAGDFKPGTLRNMMVTEGVWKVFGRLKANDKFAGEAVVFSRYSFMNLDEAKKWYGKHPEISKDLDLGGFLDLVGDLCAGKKSLVPDSETQYFSLALQDAADSTNSPASELSRLAPSGHKGATAALDDDDVNDETGDPEFHSLWKQLLSQQENFLKECRNADSHRRNHGALDQAVKTV